jgi:[ribosomal protein S5]-alanine N-acetyltransferase
MEFSEGDIIIRRFKNSDIKKLARLVNNKKIWDNLRDYVPYPYTVQDAEDYIKMCMAEEPQSTFAVQYKGELAGSIGLVPKKDVYRLSAELGYWIGEPFWGKGIATTSVKLIVNYGFKNLGLVRIYSGVFDFNKASCRVLEKSGFILEGTLKKSVIKNKNICDEYRYAKINPGI